MLLFYLEYDHGVADINFQKTSRFSDLQGSHRSYTDTIYGDIIHYVGQFLPWHRMMMHAFETLMRNECNYTGTMPWWDEQKDADSGNFFGSNMWDADTGFGGNGTGAEGCLTEGPFANTTEHIGPMLEYTTYCQKRIWDNEYGITTGNSTLIDLCNSYETYGDFWYCIVRRLFLLLFCCGFSPAPLLTV